jgi:hypothetical protein
VPEKKRLYTIKTNTYTTMMMMIATIDGGRREGEMEGMTG